MSIISIQIPELVVPGKPLGRHIHIDSRSADYPAQTAPAVVSATHESYGLPLNQGQAGSCTGNALCGALNTVPHYGTGAHGDVALTEADATAVYSAEEILMGFGPYPPNDQGGSGTEVCQAALNAGTLRAYEHATSIDEALRALVVRPVITGINWFTSFDDCDPSTGIIAITRGATVRGGHEIVATAIDAVEELVWLWQSWGLGWGLNATGRFAMSFATWETLIAQGGDVTVPRTAHGWAAPPLASLA